MKHTPGPWQVVEPVGFQAGLVKVIGNCDGDAREDGTPIYTSVHVCDVIDNNDEEANARLIAAAPDMLSVLKDLRVELEQLYKAGRVAAEPFVRAGNVIHAAEGDG